MTRALEEDDGAIAIREYSRLQRGEVVLVKMLRTVFASVDFDVNKA